MLKMLTLCASVLAFASGLALAETTLSTGEWLASDVYKANVYDPSEHKIGKVTNLVINTNGNVTAAIISVSSGFLGVNQKDVVIPFKELKVSTRDGKDWLVLNRTKDELMTAPAFPGSSRAAWAGTFGRADYLLGFRPDPSPIPRRVCRPQARSGDASTSAESGGCTGAPCRQRLLPPPSSCCHRCRAGRPRHKIETPCRGRRTPVPGSPGSRRAQTACGCATASCAPP